MQRRRGEPSFGGSYSCECMSICLSLSLRKFEGAVAKLQPPSDQHALVGFLRNIDNAKTLTGFVQELANAITDYQVRAPSPIVIFNEHPARFRYNECAIPKTSSVIMITPSVILRTSSIILRICW